MTLTAQITAARAAVNAATFGTQAFDEAFATCKALVQQQSDATPYVDTPHVILLQSRGKRHYRTVLA